jgi:hypothetical protein
MKDWAGGEIKPCSKCGKDDWKSFDDIDHDGGTCALYKCQTCGRIIHIELPD